MREQNLSTRPAAHSSETMASSFLTKTYDAFVQRMLTDVLFCRYGWLFDTYALATLFNSSTFMTNWQENRSYVLSFKESYWGEYTYLEVAETIDREQLDLIYKKKSGVPDSLPLDVAREYYEMVFIEPSEVIVSIEDLEDFLETHKGEHTLFPMNTYLVPSINRESTYYLPDFTKIIHISSCE